MLWLGTIKKAYKSSHMPNIYININKNQNFFIAKMLNCNNFFKSIINRNVEPLKPSTK